MKSTAVSSGINWIVDPVADILGTSILEETCMVRCGDYYCLVICTGGFCFGQSSTD